MSSPFKRKIRQALANAPLQAALDANAERRVSVRRQAFASLADPQGTRRKGRAIRAEVVANLDRFLEQFAANLESNGVIVHRAPDSAAAVQQVLEIACQHRVSLVAKAKTMVSEEIGLNHALEQAGLRVVETDLGEYIVQLRGERPAHIITPAVHLRRMEVGQTFHEKLGVPLTDDICTLTAVARRELRQVFLQADLGISGVNFGVADTGTLCILTNEGNGRMVTTLPRVHVALMGIERLVPTLDDLSVMLALLPRSATGQKLTVYASLIHGPRRPGELDGPQERHVILIDNGRSKLRASPLAEILYCIRCGACLNACPVFRELGGHAYVGRQGEATTYPGPIGSVVSPALFGMETFGQLARASSLCGACKDACPVEIDLPKLLLRVRAGQGPNASRPNALGPNALGPNAPLHLRWALWLFSQVASRPGIYALAQRGMGLFGRLAAPRQPWLRLPPASGWGYSKDFPRPASRPFRDRFHSASASHNTVLSDAAAALQNDPGGGEEPAPASALTTPTAAELAQTFAQELEALGGRVRMTETAGLAQAVVDLLREKDVRSIMAWGPSELPPGLLEAIEGAGIGVGFKPDPHAQAGLTGALAAAAETGTLCLTEGPGRPLSAALLPEIHLAVLSKSAIYPTLAGLIAASGASSDPNGLRGASAATLISGPSRTADIEMTLTIGVHGPREVHVFVLDDSPPPAV